MSYNVVLEPGAKQDLASAFEWYEKQLDGLGHEFLISAEASFSFLERLPESYQLIFEKFRRAPIRRFPFGIFYIIRSHTVHVIAVYHTRRDPKNWKERIYELAPGNE